MNNARRTWFLGLLSLVLCWPGPLGADEVKCTILQFNDVYEILSPRGNDGGSLARVAAIRDKLRQENPNTITMLAGDFFSPSPMMDAIDSTSGDKRLAGRQVVAVLNEFRLDLATFGNHEFDLKAAEFFDRMRECRFGWVSSNVSDQTGNPFVGVPRHKVLRFVNERGTTVRIGVISVTSDSKKTDYVSCGNPIAAARVAVAALSGRCEILIALTHLKVDEDKALAAAVPEIDLILGGHEHEALYVAPDASRHAPISKADSNVRSVYIHRLSYDTDNRNLRISSQLKDVTKDDGADPQVAATIRYWADRAFDGLQAAIAKDDPGRRTRILDHLNARRKREGKEPFTQVDFEAPFVDLPHRLEGREELVRTGETNLTRLLTNVMVETTKADLAILNSGSVRIDDDLPASRPPRPDAESADFRPIRLYDIYRVLPYLTEIVTVRMTSRRLNDLLTAGFGADLSGEGAFLQVSRNVTPGEKPRTWKVGDQRIDPNSDTVYLVAIPDFLLRGGEKAYREAGLLKERKTEEDLRAMRLDADGIALGDTDRGKGKRPEIRAALVNALIQSEEKPDIIPDPASIPRTTNRVKRPPAQSEATVRCGLIPTDGGFPAPPPPSPSPSRPRRIRK